MIENNIAALPISQAFYASKKNRFSSMRFCTWISFAIGMVLLLGLQLSTGAPYPITVFFFGFMIGAGLLVELFVRSQLKSGQPLIILTDQYIESCKFSPKLDRIAWQDIQNIGLEMGSNMLSISFKLRSVDSLNQKVRSKSKLASTIWLTAFSSEDQKKIIEAIKLRYIKVTGGDLGLTLRDPLQETTEFQEKLKNFQPKTWITYSLIAANVLVWFAMLRSGADFMHTSLPQLFSWGANAASEVQAGAWWRLLTALFLHAGFYHILMNMIALYSLGITVERIYGSWSFLIIYFAAGLLGNALSLYFGARHGISVGASGAIFGLAGALLIAVLQHREKLPTVFSKNIITNMMFFIIYSLIYGVSNKGIDNAAHVGGLVGGCLTAFILPERFDWAHFRRNFTRRVIMAIIVAFCAVVIVAMMAPRASVDQRKQLASTQFLNQGAEYFSQGMKVLQKQQQDIKAGTLSEKEIDERNKKLIAPLFHKAAMNLGQVILLPDNPKAGALRDILRMSQLLDELFNLESRINPITGKMEFVHVDTAEKIQKELAQVTPRVKDFVDHVKK